MNWDFVAILKFSKSGTNRRLWDRDVKEVKGGAPVYRREPDRNSSSQGVKSMKRQCLTQKNC